MTKALENPHVQASSSARRFTCPSGSRCVAMVAAAFAWRWLRWLLESMRGLHRRSRRRRCCSQPISESYNRRDDASQSVTVQLLHAETTGHRCIHRLYRQRETHRSWASKGLPQHPSAFTQKQHMQSRRMPQEGGCYRNLPKACCARHYVAHGRSGSLRVCLSDFYPFRSIPATMSCRFCMFTAGIGVTRTCRQQQLSALSGIIGQSGARRSSTLAVPAVWSAPQQLGWAADRAMRARDAARWQRLRACGVARRAHSKRTSFARSRGAHAFAAVLGVMRNWARVP